MRRLTLALSLALASTAGAWPAQEDLGALDASLEDPTFDVELEPRLTLVQWVAAGAELGRQDAEWHLLDSWGLAEGDDPLGPHSLSEQEEQDPCASW